MEKTKVKNFRRSWPRRKITKSARQRSEIANKWVQRSASKIQAHWEGILDIFKGHQKEDKGEGNWWPSGERDPHKDQEVPLQQCPHIWPWELRIKVQGHRPDQEVLKLSALQDHRRPKP